VHPLDVIHVDEADFSIVVRVDVDGLAPRVRVEEREVVRKPPLELEQQTVVVDVPDRLGLSQRAQRRRERRVRTDRVRIGDSGRRLWLIGIDLGHHVAALRPCVGHFHHVVRAKLPLHVQIEVVGVAVTEVDVEN
jgi:hypothetical protein